MTPLDRLAAKRIPFDAQWAARWAICRHVRVSGVGRDDVGPRYRRGSNSWRPNFVETLFNAAIEHSPCPNCGAPGGEMTSGLGYEYCYSCRTPVWMGDYVWTDLADVERYLADHAEGLVETDEDIRCSMCRRPIVDVDPTGLLQVECARSDCHLREVAPAPDGDPDAPPAPLHRPARPVLRLPPPLAADPIASALGRLERALGGAAARTGAREDETSYDASRRNFDLATAGARERDRQRSL